MRSVIMFFAIPAFVLCFRLSTGNPIDDDVLGAKRGLRFKISEEEFDSLEVPHPTHRDWSHAAQNVPFTESQKTAIKSCYKANKCKKQGGARVCTQDGKGFKNQCKLNCARSQAAFFSPVVACPPANTGK